MSADTGHHPHCIAYLITTAEHGYGISPLLTFVKSTHQSVALIIYSVARLYSTFILNNSIGTRLTWKSRLQSHLDSGRNHAPA